MFWGRIQHRCNNIFEGFERHRKTKLLLRNTFVSNHNCSLIRQILQNRLAISIFLGDYVCVTQLKPMAHMVCFGPTGFTDLFFGLRHYRAQKLTYYVNLSYVLWNSFTFLSHSDVAIHLKCHVLWPNRPRATPLSTPKVCVLCERDLYLTKLFTFLSQSNVESY